MALVSIRRRQAVRLALPAGMLAWLGLAWAARRYAETDLPGWPIAEWFAHSGKWMVFALAGLAVTASAACRDRAALDRRRALQVTAICAVLLGLTLWRTLPVYLFLDAEGARGEHGEIRQTVEYTCGPVALANLLLSLGVQDGVTERNLALLAGTTVEGTPLRGLIRAAESYGLRPEACRVMSLAEVEAHGGPALVSISTLPSVRHMTLLTGFAPDGVHFIDPAYGFRTITRERFLAIWYGKTVLVK